MSSDYSLFPATIACSRWNEHPGRTIINKAEDGLVAYDRSYTDQAIQTKVNRSFNLFKKNLESARENIRKLSPAPITPFHYILPIEQIFSLYLEEQVEHYQNQQDHRDVEVDQCCQDLKCVYARNDMSSTEAAMLIENLKNHLQQAEMLDPDLTQKISLFQDILKSDYIRRMNLAELLEPKAEAQSIRVFTSSLSKKPDSHFSVTLPRAVLERSFQLAVERIRADFDWVGPKIQKALSDPVVNKAATTIGDFMTFFQLEENPVERFTKFQQKFPAAVQLFLSVDFKSKESIATCSQALKELIKIGDFLTCFLELPEKSLGLFTSGNIEAGKNFKSQILPDSALLSADEVPILIGLYAAFGEARALYQVYLELPMQTIDKIAVSLSQANQAILKHEKEGTLFTQAPLPSLPTATHQELTSTKQLKLPAYPSSTARPSQKKKHQRQKTHKPLEARTITPIMDQSTPNTNQASNPPALTTHTDKKPASLPLATQINQLMGRLLHVYQNNRSTALRHTIWHLDSLSTLQNPPQSPLNRYALTAIACQKMLELTYQFCLEIQGKTLKAHNLKEYHRTYDPDFTAYPEIVEKLFLANHWVRYFYPQREKWNSLSTRQVQLPVVLDTLCCLSEGKPPSEQALKTQLKEMVEKTCLQIETLLNSSGLSKEQHPLTPDTRLRLKEPLKTEAFTTISDQLNDFIHEAHLLPFHPTYLYLKQAIASMDMLKATLSDLNHASNYKSFATWTSWSLQQLQESIENVLHGVEFLQTGQITASHELKTISSKLGLKMDSLADSCSGLSPKPRYPAEHLNEGEASQIIDDVAALRHFPEIEKGFTLSEASILWKKPPKETLSAATIAARLAQLIEKSQTFLNEQALPALKAMRKPS